MIREEIFACVPTQSILHVSKRHLSPGPGCIHHGLNVWTIHLPTAVPKRWCLYVSCSPAYKRQKSFSQRKSAHLPHLQHRMVAVFSYDVTLIQLPESMKAAVLNASLLRCSLTHNQWIWANLSNRAGCSSLPHLLFILREVYQLPKHWFD